MRISVLTRLSALLLLAAVVGVAVSVYLGFKKLEQPFELNTAYFETLELVSVESRSYINEYLNSGDAGVLLAAQQFIRNELQASLQRLPESIQQSIQPSLDALAQSLEVDLRAAGKLSSNTQSLLLQNERELYASLDGLRDYIDAAETSAPQTLRDEYLHITREISQLVEQRGLVRSDFFATLNPALLASLQERSQSIVNLGGKLKALPLLGVQEEVEVDEFAALMGLDAGETTESVDKGEEIISEINSLANRYASELDNTLSVIDAGVAAKKRVDGLVLQLEERARESKQTIDQMRDQVQQNVLMGVSLLLVILLIIGLGAMALQFSVIRGIGRVNEAIVRLSSGDFSQPLHWQTRFVELGALVDCANQMQKYLNQLVHEIRAEVNSVQNVSAGVSELAVNTEVRSQKQVQLTDEVSASMKELLGSFQQVAEHARRGSELTSTGQQSLLNGWQQMRDLEQVISDLANEVRDGVGMLGRLQDDTENITKVLNVIIAIADQTNLLALNAAIEAARAGDHGRGFAVVADEVRQLAQRTAESTKEIHTIIDGLGSSTQSVSNAMLAQQQRAEEAVSHSHEVGTMLKNVVDTIDQTGLLAGDIASATSEQVSEADNLMARLNQVQASAYETQQQTQASNQQSDKLMDVSRSLDKLVDSYKV